MTVRDRYDAGVPCWLDLGTPDAATSRTFYTQLFGWVAHVGDQEHGGYTLFTLGGREVAGLGPVAEADRPPAWGVSVSTRDADATAEAVKAAGGEVVQPPTDVAEGGRLAIFRDSSGATLHVWQPLLFPGARITHVPGSFTWLELHTRDQDASAAFYEAVFGWQRRTVPMGYGPYGIFSVRGRDVAGMTTMAPGFPDDAPPFWTPYFEVTDPDETAGACADLGGRVLLAPTDIEPGRFALLADPFGATFGIIRGAGKATDESPSRTTS